MQSLDSPMSWEYSGRLITTVFSSLAKRRILTTSRLLTELLKPDCVPRANSSQGDEMAPSLCGRTSEFHKCHSRAKSESFQTLTKFCPPVSGSIPFKAMVPNQESDRSHAV